MRKILVVATMLLILVGCQKYPNVPPPGYKILCDKDNNYIVEMPGKTRLYKWSYRNEPYRSHKQALKRAWEQYNYKPCPPDTVKWEEFLKG